MVHAAKQSRNTSSISLHAAVIHPVRVRAVGAIVVGVATAPVVIRVVVRIISMRIDVYFIE